MKTIQNNSLYDCKPWETRVLTDHANLLNNFQQNLCCYQRGYRKYTIKAKCELPLIRNCGKTKTISSIDNLATLDKQGNINKSTEIPSRKATKKSTKNMLGYFKKQLNLDKQNREQLFTQRIRAKQDYRAKVFLFNFQEQNKYKMMKKRELHQVIFGQRSKSRNN